MVKARERESLEAFVVLVEVVFVIGRFAASRSPRPVVVAVLAALSAAALFVVHVLRGLDFLEVHFPPQHAPHAPKPSGELGPFLRAVGHKLNHAAPLFVVLRKVVRHVFFFHNLQVHPVVGAEVLFVLLLRRRQPHHRLFLGLVVLEHDAVRVELVPHDQHLHRAELEGIQRVLEHEAVFPAVGGDLVEPLLQQLLLLHQLHVPQGLGTQLDGLVEPRLPAVRHVHFFDHRLEQPPIKHLRPLQVALEVGRTAQHQAADVGAVVADEQVRRHLRHLGHVVLPFFEAEAREPERGLAAPAVLLGQVHAELVQHLPARALQRPVQAAVAVHDDETEAVIVVQQLVERLCVELVVAQVQRRVDRLERFKVDVHLALLAVFGDDEAAVEHETVGRDVAVALEALLGRGDGAQHRLPVDATLNVRGRAILI
mmetsp:Transcript_43083/g.87117  ORF Transcript_43083/g.87117 Transcript_43083/m.87117 type:complete len:426 (-) Transcript_43083:275-1552(-)